MKANGHNYWLVICDVCGFEFRSDQVRKRWDNLIVCEKDYETRHEQEFLRTRAECNDLPFVRPEPADTFINVTYRAVTECSVLDKRGIAGYGIAGCMIPGSGF